eukprot:9129286-Lingulodinium_polyedra.AAC.1
MEAVGDVAGGRTPGRRRRRSAAPAWRAPRPSTGPRPGAARRTHSCPDSPGSRGTSLTSL